MAQTGSQSYSNPVRSGSADATGVALVTEALPLELRSTLDDQQGVAVTIYNDDLALVKDRQTVTCRPCRRTVVWRWRFAMSVPASGRRPRCCAMSTAAA